MNDRPATLNDILNSDSMKSDSMKSDSAKHPARRNMPAEEREKWIIEGAIRFFAQVGFDGRTRDLADFLGVAQPLIYRYFATKEALVERIFQEIYLAPWRNEWSRIIDNRSRSMRARLVDFYSSYTDVVFTREWVRIFMYAGLSGSDLNVKYVKMVNDRLLTPLILEMRLYILGSEVAHIPVLAEELAIARALHHSIFFLGVRKHVYHIEEDIAKNELIGILVDQFLAGASHTWPRLFVSLDRTDPHH